MAKNVSSIDSATSKIRKAISQWQQAKTNANRAENQFKVGTVVVLASVTMIPLARKRLLATLAPLSMLPVWHKIAEKLGKCNVELRHARRVKDDESQNFVRAKTHANNVLQQASSNILEACQQQQTNSTKAKLVPAMEDLDWDTEAMWRNLAQEMISELNNVDATINVVREPRQDIFYPGTDFLRLDFNQTSMYLQWPRSSDNDKILALAQKIKNAAK